MAYIASGPCIGVGRGGPGPPLIWEGGPTYPLPPPPPPPPNNASTCTGKTIPLNSILEFSIISYFKMRNVIIWHWFIKNLLGTWRRNDVMCHVPAGNLAPLAPPPLPPPPPPQYSKFSYAYAVVSEHDKQCMPCSAEFSMTLQVGVGVKWPCTCIKGAEIILWPCLNSEKTDQWHHFIKHAIRRKRSHHAPTLTLTQNEMWSKGILRIYHFTE